jgi:C4-dicarboxylate transporter
MVDSIKIQTLKTLGTMMTTAFAFVAGLAWNGAIQALINDFLKAGSATIGLVIYAIVVTIIAVIVTIIIGRTLGKSGIELEDI